MTTAVRKGKEEQHKERRGEKRRTGGMGGLTQMLEAQIVTLQVTMT